MTPESLPPDAFRWLRRTASCCAAVVASGLLLSSCSRAPAGGRAERSGRAPVPVLAAQAVAKDVPVEVQAIGTVQAFSLVSIRSQITGPITAVHFHEGQEVRKGDLLFTLDRRPWRAALNQARANLERDEAQMISARLEFERTSNLFATKIASQSDYDTAQASYEAMVATLAADHAAVSNAEISLSYTEIRSPIDGRTGNLVVKQGNIVKSPDDVMLTLAQIHPIYVAFAVPEQQLPLIRRESRGRSLTVTAVVPGQSDSPAYGKLTFIDNQVATNTGTILLKGTFPNTNEVLWPGQFVQVSLTLSNLVHATIVPAQAVQTGQQGEFVFIVKPDQTVEPRPVRTSITYDGHIVIASGVQPGETVVTDGQLRLVPGSRVEVKTAEASGLAPVAESSAKQP